MYHTLCSVQTKKHFSETCVSDIVINKYLFQPLGIYVTTYVGKSKKLLTTMLKNNAPDKFFFGLNKAVHT